VIVKSTSIQLKVTIYEALRGPGQQSSLCTANLVSEKKRFQGLTQWVPHNKQHNIFVFVLSTPFPKYRINQNVVVAPSSKEKCSMQKSFVQERGCYGSEARVQGQAEGEVYRVITRAKPEP